MCCAAAMFTNCNVSQVYGIVPIQVDRIFPCRSGDWETHPRAPSGRRFLDGDGSNNSSRGNHTIEGVNTSNIVPLIEGKDNSFG